MRIGDSTMTPLDHPGVLDLAKSTKRTELLELYCLMRSELLLGCESGLFRGQLSYKHAIFER